MQFSCTRITAAVLPLLAFQVSVVAIPFTAPPAAIRTRQELDPSTGNSTLPDIADVGGSVSLAAAADTKTLRERRLLISGITFD